MTLPGLALFYGGLVRRKNVVSVLLQCFAITGVVTLIWTAFGYSLAFDTTGMAAGESGLHAFVGTFSKAFLRGVSADSVTGTIPEVLFFAFQLTFAIITPGLIIGAFAERMKFSAMLLFTGLWAVFCYVPIAHMVWAGEGSFLGDLGFIDFAGGAVVHITAGTAALTWMLIETVRVGKPSALGFATGAIAGLAAITPAAGTVGPVGAMAIGLVAGTLGYVAATSLKFRFRYDDALDVVGVHGVGGFVGIVMLAVFSATALGGSMENLDIPRQLGVQILGGLFTVVYTAIVSVADPEGRGFPRRPEGPGTRGSRGTRPDPARRGRLPRHLAGRGACLAGHFDPVEQCHPLGGIAERHGPEADSGQLSQTDPRPRQVLHVDGRVAHACTEHGPFQ